MEQPCRRYLLLKSKNPSVSQPSGSFTTCNDMTTTPQRLTPETDAATFWGRDMGGDKGPPHFECVDADMARNFERQRDEARSERDQLSRELSSLLAGDCLDGHDAVEGARNGIAMRKAIKEAYEAFLTFNEVGPRRAFFDARDNALAKLQPFIKP